MFHYVHLENTSIDPNDKLELQNLLDLLIVYLKEYDKLLATKVYTVEEFTQCKRTLAQLHSQIKEKGERLGYKMTSVSPSFPENSQAGKWSI